jgi:hypothetical protein
MAQGLLAPAKLQAFGLRNYTPSATAQLLDDAVERDALAESTSAKRCVGETGKSMKAVELAVCLLKFWQGGCHGQPSSAKLGSQNCRDPDYHPTKSRLGFPVPVGGKGFPTGTAPRL